PLDYKGAPGLLEIYNRWGQVIFSTRNLAQGWNGSGAPDGTYFYIVTPDEPGAAALTGHITLVR
ncbi:MAG: gliding motility-associated C-terminal domain-containing protein, partial [Flavobacteriales bacterium]|nr:gliding motility-associated C-terminal domain-containing protein [Flavobacteriales bacterium]